MRNPRPRVRACMYICAELNGSYGTRAWMYRKRETWQNAQVQPGNHVYTTTRTCVHRLQAQRTYICLLPHTHLLPTTYYLPTSTTTTRLKIVEARLTIVRRAPEARVHDRGSIPHDHGVRTCCNLFGHSVSLIRYFDCKSVD